jgi:hypothetical protein
VSTRRRYAFVGGIKEDLNKVLPIGNSHAPAILIQKVYAGLRERLYQAVKSVRSGGESRMDGPIGEAIVGDFLKDLWSWETDQALELSVAGVVLELDQAEIGRTVRLMEVQIQEFSDRRRDMLRTESEKRSRMSAIFAQICWVSKMLGNRNQYLTSRSPSMSHGAFRMFLNVERTPAVREDEGRPELP